MGPQGAMVLGLPLMHVLTVSELRAVPPTRPAIRLIDSVRGRPPAALQNVTGTRHR